MYPFVSRSRQSIQTSRAQIPREACTGFNNFVKIRGADVKPLEKELNWYLRLRSSSVISPRFWLNSAFAWAIKVKASRACLQVILCFRLIRYLTVGGKYLSTD